MREQEQMTLAKAQEPTKQISEDDVDFLEGIAKSLDDGKDVEYEALTKGFGQMVALLKGYETRTEAAETVAKAERDIRLTGEMVEVVKGWQALPLDAEGLPLVLKRAKEALDDDDFAALTKAFDAANEAAQMTIDSGESIFDEIGKRGSGEKDADELEIAVTKRMADNPGETRQVAIAKVLDANPKLYEQTL